MKIKEKIINEYYRQKAIEFYEFDRKKENLKIYPDQQGRDKKEDHRILSLAGRAVHKSIRYQNDTKLKIFNRKLKAVLYTILSVLKD